MDAALIIISAAQRVEHYRSPRTVASDLAELLWRKHASTLLEKKR